MLPLPLAGEGRGEGMCNDQNRKKTVSLMLLPNITATCAAGTLSLALSRTRERGLKPLLTITISRKNDH